MSNKSYTNQSAIYTDPILGEHLMGIAGNVNASITSGLVMPIYDYVSIEYYNTTTEIYSFKTGGASGVVVSTITLVYTNATKSQLSTVTKI